MTASWCPRLRHQVDNKVQVREDVSNGVAASSTGQRRDVSAPVHPSIDFGGNSPAHALGKSELAYDLPPSHQAEEDDWQPTSTAHGVHDKFGQAVGGVSRKGDRVGAKEKQTWLSADSGWYDQWQKPSWNSPDHWSSKSTSKGGWEAAQAGWWASDVSRAAWPPAVPIGAGKDARKGGSAPRDPKEQKQQPLRRHGKAAPYAAAAASADPTSAATVAAGGAAEPSEAKGKLGKKAPRKDAELKWVAKDAVSDQPSKGKGNDADPSGIVEQESNPSGEAAKRDIASRSKQRPVLQWRAVGRGRGAGNGGDVQGGDVEVARSRGRGRGR